MKRFRPHLVACALATALTLGAAAAPASAHFQFLPNLTGTWRVTVTTFNCATQVANPPFKSFLTFSADGTYLETWGTPG